MLMIRIPYIVVAIQLAVLGLAGLAYLGFDIPVLRQLIGVIYLFFIPGILVMKILKPQTLGIIETILYCVGVSIVFSMSLGLFANAIFPHFGILRPLSTFSVLITMNIVVSILCFWAYKRDKRLLSHYEIDLRGLLSPPFLFVILITLLSALGAKTLDAYDNNYLAISMPIIISAVIVLSVVFRKRLPKEYYPIAIFFISLAILLSRNLACPYLMGKCDPHVEMYFFKSTLEEGYWNGGLSISPVSQMLSTTIFPTICSTVAGIQPVLVAKLIVPLLRALFLVGLYQIYITYVSKVGAEGAFLAACLIVIQQYFGLEGEEIRTSVAAFFVVSLLFTILSKRKDMKIRVIAIILSCGLVLSHYSTSYIVLICLCFSWILNSLLSSNKQKTSNEQNSSFYGNFVLLFGILALSWYMFTAGGASFLGLAYFGHNVVNSISEFFDLSRRSYFIATAVGALQPSTIIGVIRLYITYCTLFFLIVGFLNSMVLFARGKFDRQYSILSVSFMAILAANVVFPYASVGFGVRRAYIFSLFILAPFFVTGGYSIMMAIEKSINYLSNPMSRFCITKIGYVQSGKFYEEIIQRLLIYIKSFNDLNIQSKLVTLRIAFFSNFKPALVSFVLISLFLFEIGFVYQVGGVVKGSPLSLNSDSLDHDINYIYSHDVAAVDWFSTNTNSSSICGDMWAGGGTPILASYGSLLWYPYEQSSWNHFDLEFGMKIPEATYVYLCHLNVVKGDTLLKSKSGILEYVSIQDTELGKKVLPVRSRIYNNGGADVYM